MQKWTLEEKLVVVYYASRNIKHATIVNLLAKKCSTELRTESQVAHKLVELRIASGHKGYVKGTGGAQNAQNRGWDRGWDRKLADQWLFSNMEKERLEELLDLDDETAAIIGEVSVV